MSIYFWWAVNIALATALASVTIIPRWPRLRRALGIESPTEYLQMRYNRAAQLLIAISGIGSKLLDVADKMDFHRYPAPRSLRVCPFGSALSSPA